MANFWKSNLWQAVLNADWAWVTIAWLLLIGAVLLFLWAIFRDRPGLWGIPEERCPKCRYDMAGRAEDREESDGPIQCPECGKRVRHAKALRRTRRRWGLALLVVPLLVGWHLARHKEHIRHYGWAYMIPTAVLVFVVDTNCWQHSATGNFPPSGILEAELSSRFETMPRWTVPTMVWRYKRASGDRVIVDQNVSGLWPAKVEIKPVYNDFLGRLYPPVKQVTSDHDWARYSFRDLIQLTFEPEEWVEYGGNTRFVIEFRDTAVFNLEPGASLPIGEIFTLIAEHAGGQEPFVIERIYQDKSLCVIPLEHSFQNTGWIAAGITDQYADYLENHDRQSAGIQNLPREHREYQQSSLGPLLAQEEFDADTMDREIWYACDRARELIVETFGFNEIDAEGRVMGACECINNSIVMILEGGSEGQIINLIDRIIEIGPDAARIELGLDP